MPRPSAVQRLFSLACLLAVLLAPLALHGQTEEVEPGTHPHTRHTTGLWLGVYSKYRLSDRWSYYGEYHLRRRNEFINDMAQIYLRFGMTYHASKRVELTAGVVLPIYWAPVQDLEGQDNVAMQYRLWQQALITHHWGRLKIQHQLRTEQRWRRAYTQGAPFLLDYRFRYKLNLYLPLGPHDHIEPGTAYINAYEEFFLQVGNGFYLQPHEDNRAFIGLGFQVSKQWGVTAGYMWSFRPTRLPGVYESRHIPRLCIYHNLGLRPERQRGLPPPAH